MKQKEIMPNNFYRLKPQKCAIQGAYSRPLSQYLLELNLLSVLFNRQVFQGLSVPALNNFRLNIFAQTSLQQSPSSVSIYSSCDQQHLCLDWTDPF